MAGCVRPRGKTPPGGGRADDRLHVVAALRTRDVGLPPGPASAGILFQADGTLGSRLELRARAHVPDPVLPRADRERLPFGKSAGGPLGSTFTGPRRPLILRPMFRSFFFAGFEG